MHIAVCDDNIADRKQTERLLGKEAAKRISVYGSLYVDSFGSADSLYKAPMIYDLFFVDMTGNPPHGMEVAIKLRELGVTAPICMCRSEIEYEKFVNKPDNLMFLDKPIKVSELEAIIDSAIEIKGNVEASIELRDGKHTYYIGTNQIVSCTERAHEVEIKLVDDETVYQIGNIGDMCVILQNLDNYASVGRKYIVNLNRIVKIDGKNLIMDDQSKIPLGLFEKSKFRNFLENRDKE